ncbi:IclR family transcriptional regulator [Rhodoligotrophos defluvii]|uniref:IclR family transcriptional regulator n=1 Tax=Rhodoligotrophos defluvii TaxID=2561934 RepID=UPI0010C9A28F|nr:IclR family transcriptional regulator [Rhodoligotrophos defluvii]
MSAEKPLERYMRIIEVVSGFPDGISLTALATALALPKTTAHRLLKGLTDVGMVELKGQTYRLGPRLTNLLYASADDGWIRAVSQPLLQELAAATDQVCFIARLDGAAVRSIAMVAPDNPVRPYVMPGREIPLHTGASAKALLAFLDRDRRLALLPDPLPRLTAQTKTDLADIEAEWAEIRRTGVAFCIGEDVEGFAGIAMPVRVEGKPIRYSLCLTGTIDGLINGRRDDHVRHLSACAARLARLLAARLP